jgi:hypothetical protein
MVSFHCVNLTGLKRHFISYLQVNSPYTRFERCMLTNSHTERPVKTSKQHCRSRNFESRLLVCSGDGSAACSQQLQLLLNSAGLGESGRMTHPAEGSSVHPPRFQSFLTHASVPCIHFLLCGL